MSRRRRLRVVLLGAGTVMLVAAGLWLLAGGPAGAAVPAAIGLVLVAATAPPDRHGGPPSGPGWGGDGAGAGSGLGG